MKNRLPAYFTAQRQPTHGSNPRRPAEGPAQSAPAQTAAPAAYLPQERRFAVVVLQDGRLVDTPPELRFLTAAAAQKILNHFGPPTAERPGIPAIVPEPTAWPAATDTA